MTDQLAAAWRELPQFLSSHVLVSASALTLAVAIALPLALLAARRPRLRVVVLTLAQVVQTIPGLALLALFYPLLLGLGALTQAVAGFSVPALGFLPSLLALTLYAILPILRNGVIGLTGIDARVLEAADGVGMTARQKLLEVEVPLAAPVVMAGVRTAAVWTIGAATLSTSVGQTSLGNYIFSGLQTENWVFVLFGCAAATMLALLADVFLGLVERGLSDRDRRSLLAGAAGLFVGSVLALAAGALAGAPAGPRYVIGAKNFSEQFILAELMSAQVEKSGARAIRKESLGSAVAFRALASGDIDAYVDYSGTLWTNVLGRTDTPARDDMLKQLEAELLRRHGVLVLGRLGFENAYVLAMKGDRARADGFVSVADVAAKAKTLTLGSDLEFLSRPEWAALKQAYGLAFSAEKSFSPTFMYRALNEGAADVISAFSSDGRIAADRLTVLTDPKGAIPAYDAVILISPRRATDGRLRRALEPLIGAIPVERMREANLMVDRDDQKATPREAAKVLAAKLLPAMRTDP